MPPDADALVDPLPPCAGLRLRWDDPGVPDPVVALSAARDELGDTYVVDSGRDRMLFVFGPESLQDFCALPERVASKGLADYRMLLRKLPKELFADRRGGVARAAAPCPVAYRARRS